MVFFFLVGWSGYCLGFFSLYLTSYIDEIPQGVHLRLFPTGSGCARVVLPKSNNSSGRWQRERRAGRAAALPPPA